MIITSNANKANKGDAESFLGIKQIINPIANTLSATASNFAPFKEVTFQYLASLHLAYLLKQQ